jgi:hypothetical protein
MPNKIQSQLANVLFARLALSDVFDWFVEGFDTPDLQAALALES